MNDTPKSADNREQPLMKRTLFCQEVVLDFAEIAGGRPEILIEYKGQRYRLRATKKGKLILNK